MAHNIDWGKFEYPWNVLGPKMQLELRKDVEMIIRKSILSLKEEPVTQPYKKTMVADRTSYRK
jgi:hypothetical protein